jgi:hypothetical protein
VFFFKNCFFFNPSSEINLPTHPLAPTLKSLVCLNERRKRERESV